jgi:hypothetical protein
MIKITIPGDEISRLLNNFSINSKLEKIGEEKINDKMKQINVEMEEVVPSSKVELNKKIAEWNGIPISELLNCPNYKVLVEEYQNYFVSVFRQKLIEAFGLDFDEANVLLAQMAGVIPGF